MDVEVITAQHCIFAGIVTSAAFRTTEATTELQAENDIYLCLPEISGLILRCDSETRAFQLRTAVASFSNGKLTVVAEEVFPLIAGG